MDVAAAASPISNYDPKRKAEVEDRLLAGVLLIEERAATATFHFRRDACERNQPATHHQHAGTGRRLPFFRLPGVDSLMLGVAPLTP